MVHFSLLRAFLILAFVPFRVFPPFSTLCTPEQFSLLRIDDEKADFCLSNHVIDSERGGKWSEWKVRRKCKNRKCGEKEGRGGWGELMMGAAIVDLSCFYFFLSPSISLFPLTYNFYFGQQLLKQSTNWLENINSNIIEYKFFLPHHPKQGSTAKTEIEEKLLPHHVVKF